MFFSILGSLLAFTVPWFIIDSFLSQNAPRVLSMGAAEYLVSGDADLLDLGRYGNVKVATPREFAGVLDL